MHIVNENYTFKPLKFDLLNKRYFPNSVEEFKQEESFMYSEVYEVENGEIVNPHRILLLRLGRNKRLKPL